MKILPSVRVGMALSLLWLLCDTARGHRAYYYSPRNTLTEAFTVFWGQIGVSLNPSGDPRDWPVKAIAMTLLFLLPIFIWWAAKPLLSRARPLLTQDGGSGKRI